MDIFEEIVRLRAQGRKCALATIVQVRGSIPSHETAKLLVRDDGSIVGTVGGGCVEAEVWAAAREVIDTGEPRQMHFSLNQDAAYDNGLICGGQLDVFIEPVEPQPAAVIFGAGHISKSLAKVASIAGFRTTVVDDRETFASRERFPDVDEVIAGDYDDVFQRLPVHSGTYLIIVTRGHRDDMRVLEWAVQTPAVYVSMIGSRRKVLGVVRELVAGGMAPELFERIHAPMGLEIGAITPEEIAVSVVAEMIAVRRKPTGEWQAISKTYRAVEKLQETRAQAR
ncbi:MAG TPA: XdhC/CoxI family protein [Bryobacteraceae bacterium]|nr:XdhC/CoxI family protein [Bryobacteraceae bacterium]